jgi:hypothetical protein
MKKFFKSDLFEITMIIFFCGAIGIITGSIIGALAIGGGVSTLLILFKKDEGK